MATRSPARPKKTLAPIRSATVPVVALSPHPRNYRQHPEIQLKRLEASVARFGQVRSIVVQEGADGRYLIVAGHGLVQAAQAKGLQELRADVIPATWTAEQVEGYLVADNETARGAFDDEVMLAEMLREQKATGQDLTSLGYSDGELDALLEALTQAEDSEWFATMQALPDGDKSPFEQMTFTLTETQAKIVRRALANAKDEAPSLDESGNANSNGNALAYMAASYLHKAVEA